MCSCIKLKHGWFPFLFFFVTSRRRKRKRAFFHESLLEGATHFMVKENDQRIINNVVWVVGVLGDKNRIPRGPTRDRNVRKEQWTELYNQKSAEEFSEKMRINRTTFNLLLNTLGRCFWDFERIEMHIFQQGNLPYSCLLLWRIRQVAWDWRAVGSGSWWIYKKLWLSSCWCMVWLSYPCKFTVEG